MKNTFHRFILWLQHIFHIISNVHPCVWMGLYLVLIPIFAFFYWLLPDGQFRIPDDGGTNFGSWIYYSIVTITTLGFGDYTPAHGWSQAITAIEVMSGLLCMGFFLNSVGAMHGEAEVDAEVEKQRQIHLAQEKDKLVKSTPVICHILNAFIKQCEEATSRGNTTLTFAPELTKAAARASLSIDSFQNRVDLTLWPDLLEPCFAFVANYQIMASDVSSLTHDPDPTAESQELKNFIQDNTKLAQTIETLLNKISAS